jgi:mono/diheme cytochrome c family protein
MTLSLNIRLTASRWLAALALAAALPSAGWAEELTVEQQAGIYVERLADCMSCHTQPGGTPFAGGRQIGTPFGTLSSPNITPDKDTGIGRWSDDDFYRAVHEGIGHRGEYLYPVMPYTSFTKMTREDVLAIKAYLFTLKPVFAPRPPNGLYFPFDIRSSLFVWRELFFHPGTYQPNPKHSADWNRGAYIVEGPGHCGECHSPRNILGGTETQAGLSGGVVQQWLAPNISSDPLAGIGDRTVEQIETFLHTGADRPMGVAFGPMAEVVHNSLRYATKADIHSIAVYLKEGPDRTAAVLTGLATPAELRQGRHLYLTNCAECHQDNGRGIPGSVADLAGNAALAADQPNDVIVAVLQGLHGNGGYGQMPSFAGALTDANIADIVNYVRTAWRDKAPANATPQLVESLRTQSNVGAGGTEAARAFDCPQVGSGVLPGALATAAQANFLGSDDGAFLNQRVVEMATQLRQQRPGISDAQLSNTMNAAFCPAVANRSDLSTSQKRALLVKLNTLVQNQIAAAVPAQGSVLASVPLSPSVAQDLNNAAAAKHQSPAAYMADLLAKAAGGK